MSQNRAEKVIEINSKMLLTIESAISKLEQ